MVGPLIAFGSYLLGSVHLGYLIVRWKKGIDVRTTGSGSIGATNVMRNFGLAGFLATFLLDAGKGLGAVWLAEKMTGNDPRWIAAAGVAIMAGHCFPVWLKFRGGKGMATGLGVFISFAPLPLGAAFVLFAVAVAIWRYVSLGSILSAAAFPALFYLLQHPPPEMLLGAIGGAAIVIAKHHTNIRRLLKGTENRLGGKLPRSGGPEGGEGS